MDNRNEIEFDLMQMVRYLLKRVWVILLATIIFAVGGNFISKSVTVPQYMSHCRIYVYQRATVGEGTVGEGTGGESVDHSGLLFASQLANDCEVLITGVNVTEKVVEQLDLNVSPSYISHRLTVSSEANTRILQIEYTDSDPQRAVTILNKVCEVATIQIKDIMNVDAVTTIYDAQLPNGPVKSTTDRDTILAAAVGAVLAIGVLVVLFLMDDTIRNEDDVERYLSLSTLAAIPISADLTPEAKNGETIKGKHLARIIKK